MNEEPSFHEVIDGVIVVKNWATETIQQNCVHREVVLIGNSLIFFGNCTISIAESVFNNNVAQFVTHFVVNPVHQNFTKIPGKVSLDKVPVHSVKNRERIEYLQYKHQALTWGLSTSGVVIIIAAVVIVSWRWGCVCGKIWGSVSRNIDGKKHRTNVVDGLPVYEVPELDESRNWPKMKTRDIVRVVDSNPWEFDETPDGSLELQDRVSTSVVGIPAENRQLAGIPETPVRNLPPKKPRVLTWDTPIESIMGTRALVTNTERCSQRYYENHENNKVMGKPVVRHEPEVLGKKGIQAHGVQ